MNATADTLNPNFYTVGECVRQRMRTKDWAKVLLDGRDRIIYKGCLRQLLARKLGAGIVEIYMAPEDAE